MKQSLKITVFFVFLLFLFSFFSLPSPLISSNDDILLNTLDYSKGEGKGGKIPSFTINKKYTITYIGAYFGAIYTKANPTVRYWISGTGGSKVAGGELVSESGQGVADAIMSNTGTFTLEPGTYKFYTDDLTTWKFNKDAYYQVLIKGIPE